MEGSRVTVSTLPVPTLRLQVPCWRPALLSTGRGQGQHYQQRCSQTGSLGGDARVWKQGLLSPVQVGQGKGASTRLPSGP